MSHIGILAVFLSFFSLVLPVANVSAAVPPPVKDQGYGLAVSSHPLASAVGMEVLKSGGTAVDAAVAVGFALAVVHPAAGNLGGGGFALIRPADGKTMVADFREKAPALASRDMFLDETGAVIPEMSTVGHKAAAVPGTVAGLCAILDRYGTRKLGDLMLPAIELAERGFAVNAAQELAFAGYATVLSRFAASRQYFFKPDNTLYKEGDTLVQKDLARTLELIAKHGASGFYDGEIARLVEKDMVENGGLITREDLAAYEVDWKEPLKGTYRNYEIRTVGLPSSGGVLLLQLLNVMELSDITAMGAGSSETVHFMAEAMRRAFADRAAYLGDEASVKTVVPKLASKEYAREIHAVILNSKGKAGAKQTGSPAPPKKETSSTTHYSVVDAWGNAVSVTYTLNDNFGCGVAVPGAGFLLNNEMDDFAVAPGAVNIYGLTGGSANEIAPGKRPLSSMTPAIVLKDGKNFLVLGSPGGPRIITSVLQVLSNAVDHGMNVSEAVMAPRFHLQGPDNELRAEPLGLSRDTATALEAMGYAITVKEPMGDVNALLKDPETGVWYGVEDPRTGF